MLSNRGHPAFPALRPAFPTSRQKAEIAMAEAKREKLKELEREMSSSSGLAQASAQSWPMSPTVTPHKSDVARTASLSPEPPSTPTLSPGPRSTSPGPDIRSSPAGHREWPMLFEAGNVFGLSAEDSERLVESLWPRRKRFETLNTLRRHKVVRRLRFMIADGEHGRRGERLVEGHWVNNDKVRSLLIEQRGIVALHTCRRCKEGGDGVVFLECVKMKVDKGVVCSNCAYWHKQCK